MKKFLIQFNDLLLHLKDENMVLAGTCILQYHGLKMSRNPADLDVVIFEPNPRQMTILETLKTLHPIKSDENDYPVDAMSEFKVTRGGLTLNILIEHHPTPEDLLFLLHEGVYFKAQSIENNMIAKCSFRTKEHQPRIKDVLDCLDLKNSNFNY